MKVFHVVAAALLATGLVFAQATTAPAAPSKAKAAPAAAVKVINGTIVSVDAIGNTVIIKTAKVEDTLSVTDSTKIKVGGKEGKIGDLTTDMKVTAQYKKEEGKKVAVKISEKKATAAKAAKPAAPAAPAAQ